MTDKSMLSNFTKMQLLEMLDTKNNLIDTLQERILEIEHEKRRTASWQRDKKGVLRCTSCGHSAPKKYDLYYSKTERVLTPYCWNCGAKMEDEEE